MPKILGGVLGLMAVVAMVAGVGYALFSSQATVSGSQITTGTAGLLLWNPLTSEWSEEIDVSPRDAELYLPGDVFGIPMYLANTSTEGLNMDLLLQLFPDPNDPPSAGWDALKDYLELVVCLPSAVVDGVCDDSDDSTGWMSFDQWSQGQQLLPGTALPGGDEPAGAPAGEANVREYWVNTRLSASAGEDQVGRLITFDSVFTGTQVPKR